MKMKSKSGAVLGALSAAALVSAFAATLGGLTSPTLGADAVVVASCDTTGIDISYGYTYNPASEQYDISAVNLLGLNDNCNGLIVNVALGGAGPALIIQEVNHPIVLVDIDGISADQAGLTDDFSVPFSPNTPAEPVVNVAVVIS